MGSEPGGGDPEAPLLGRAMGSAFSDSSPEEDQGWGEVQARVGSTVMVHLVTANFLG